MPDKVVELIEKNWTKSITDASGGHIWPADEHAQK